MTELCQHCRTSSTCLHYCRAPQQLLHTVAQAPSRASSQAPFLTPTFPRRICRRNMTFVTWTASAMPASTATSTFLNTAAHAGPRAQCQPSQTGWLCSQTTCSQKLTLRLRWASAAAMTDSAVHACSYGPVCSEPCTQYMPLLVVAHH